MTGSTVRRYALALLVALAVAEVSYRFLRPLTDGALTRAPLLIATLLYFPLLQGWLGREFELVITLAVAGAYWATVHDKRGTLGALLAYVALYKYLPFLSVPYLRVRRWWSSVTAFLATTAVLLVAAQWLVGLEGFVKNHIPGNFPGELILLGLVLHQYATLPVGPPTTDRAWAPNAASRRPAPGYGGRP